MSKRDESRTESYRLLYHLYRTGIIPKSDLSLYRGKQRDRYAQLLLKAHIQSQRTGVINYYKCDYCYITPEGINYLISNHRYPHGISIEDYASWQNEHPCASPLLPQPHKPLGTSQAFGAMSAKHETCNHQFNPSGEPRTSSKDTTLVGTSKSGNPLTKNSREPLCPPKGAPPTACSRSPDKKDSLVVLGGEGERSIASNGERAPEVKGNPIKKGTPKNGELPWETWEPSPWRPAFRNFAREKSLRNLMENNRGPTFRRTIRRSGVENILFGAGVLVYSEDKPSYAQMISCLSHPAFSESFIWNQVRNHGIYYARKEMHIPGEPMYSNRMIGVLLTQNGWYAIYNTLGRFSKWIHNIENAAIQRLGREMASTLAYRDISQRCITFSVGCGMISAMVTGHSYGTASNRNIPDFINLGSHSGGLMTADTLSLLFDEVQLVELNSNGLDSIMSIVDQELDCAEETKRALAEDNPSLLKLFTSQAGGSVLLDIGTGNEAVFLDGCDILLLRKIRTGGGKVTIIGPERLSRQVSKSLADSLDRYLDTRSGVFIDIPRFDYNGQPV